MRPNDAACRYAKRWVAAMLRTMHRCDRLDKLPSISIDQRISRRRQSQAFYTRFYCPSQTGQKPPRARLQASTRAQNRQSAVLELSCLSGKAYPKRGPRGWQIVIAVVPASARQSRFEVELDICVSSCFHRGRGPVTLSLCSRQGISLTRLRCCYRRGRGPVLLRWIHGIMAVVPPWRWPGDIDGGYGLLGSGSIELLFGPGRGAGQKVNILCFPKPLSPKSFRGGQPLEGGACRARQSAKAH
jgi:hypothetical protein